MKQVSYYDFCDPHLGMIMSWFHLSFGFKITQKEAVAFSIKTTEFISEGVVYDKVISLQAMAGIRHVTITDDLFLRFKQVKSSAFDLIQFSGPMALSAIIILRSITLPEVKDFEMAVSEVGKQPGKSRGRIKLDDIIRKKVIRKVSGHARRLLI